MIASNWSSQFQPQAAQSQGGYGSVLSGRTGGLGGLLSGLNGSQGMQPPQQPHMGAYGQIGGFGNQFGGQFGGFPQQGGFGFSGGGFGIPFGGGFNMPFGMGGFSPYGMGAFNPFAMGGGMGGFGGGFGGGFNPMMGGGMGGFGGMGGGFGFNPMQQYQQAMMQQRAMQGDGNPFGGQFGSGQFSPQGPHGGYDLYGGRVGTQTNQRPNYGGGNPASLMTDWRDSLPSYGEIVGFKGQLG